MASQLMGARPLAFSGLLIKQSSQSAVEWGATPKIDAGKGAHLDSLPVPMVWGPCGGA